MTGASEPKRFEHCVGVYHLANLWAASRSLSTRQVEVVRAAALLHDIQTGPFGHSFQYVMEDNPFEQRFEHTNLASGVRTRFLQRSAWAASFSGRRFITSDLLGDLASDVFTAIEGRGALGPIISGTLDLDNLDNVVRLAFHMGLCGDSDRDLPRSLAPMLEPTDDGLAAPRAALPLFERWFEIRRELYEYLLLDRGEFAAKAMLTLAVERAVAAQLLGPDDWRLTDEELLENLHDRSVGEHQVIGQLIKRLKVGDLFECIAVWQSPTVSDYSQLSEALAKRELEHVIEERLTGAGLHKLRVCVHYILDKKKTCRSIAFRVLKTEEDVIVGHDSSNLLVGVFVENARATGLTPSERLRACEVIKVVLEGKGLANISLAPDPLSVPSDDTRLLV
ncbi:HD domain-containing protein [Sphingobium sp. S6]|uniref:HD domain-containing protein n=1 Tax=Sphingobium sp. S6 TaxID=2758386 RepID=UPI0022A6D5E0|nr:HD domain-containing protein [Sphingobium sp. S6]